MKTGPKDTEYWQVDAGQPDNEIIKKAGQILRAGGLVAFPTETVYGLGANARDGAAAGKIFAAKGRPLDNPLIVHLAGPEGVTGVAANLPPVAQALMKAYWPGPLTLVLPAAGLLPPEVTAGLDTVAVRMPDHPVALALIKAAGLPVAAPSANISGRPSPTTAAHVLHDLGGRIDVILDGGPTSLGMESTVLDVTGEIPLILRPGSITPAQIKKIAGAVEIDTAVFAAGHGMHSDGMHASNKNDRPRAPGVKYKHYAPRASLVLVEGDPEAVGKRLRQMADKYIHKGLRTGILCADETKDAYPGGELVHWGRRGDIQSMAAGLYRALRILDSRGVDIILVEGMADQELGLAVMNRLRQAAGRIIVV